MAASHSPPEEEKTGAGGAPEDTEDDEEAQEETPGVVSDDDTRRRLFTAFKSVAIRWCNGMVFSTVVLVCCGGRCSPLGGWTAGAVYRV